LNYVCWIYNSTTPKRHVETLRNWNIQFQLKKRNTYWNGIDNLGLFSSFPSQIKPLSCRCVCIYIYIFCIYYFYIFLNKKHFKKNNTPRKASSKADLNCEGFYFLTWKNLWLQNPNAKVELTLSPFRPRHAPWQEPQTTRMTRIFFRFHVYFLEITGSSLTNLKTTGDLHSR
jgi:hypothetical protein